MTEIVMTQTRNDTQELGITKSWSFITIPRRRISIDNEYHRFGSRIGLDGVTI